MSERAVKLGGLAHGAIRARGRLGTAGCLVALCLLIAAVSLAWPHTLTYDPWSWALWGREIVHGSLSTTGGTSWKPLPAVFDSVFSLFGGLGPDLWLILARAGSLMALLLAFHLGARIAGPLAGVLALAWVAVSGHSGFVFGWFLFFGSGWSEGLLTALSLGALVAHAENLPRAALGAWFAAALIRPEAGVALLLYGVMVARRSPELRRLVVLLLLALVALWVIPDYLGSGHLFGGSQRALGEVPPSLARSKHPGLRDVALFRDLLSPPVLIGVILALVCHRSRRRLIVAVLGVAVAWLVIVAVMAEAGYPGIPRFLVVSVSLSCVVAGIGWSYAARLVPRGPARLAAVAAVLALNVAFLAGHTSDVRHQVRRDLDEARENAQLAEVLRRSGGAAAVRRCGVVRTDPLQIPAVVWDLGEGSRVTYRALRTGMIFRTLTPGQRRAFPPVPAANSGYRLIARAGTWAVYADCRTQAR